MAVVVFLVLPLDSRAGLREGHRVLVGRVDVQAVQEPHPLAKLSIPGLGGSPKLQVEEAARVELDLELILTLIVDKKMHKLQGEESGGGGEGSTADGVTSPLAPRLAGRSPRAGGVTQGRGLAPTFRSFETAPLSLCSFVQPSFLLGVPLNHSPDTVSWAAYCSA